MSGLLVGDDFDRLFTSFDYTAFHLEQQDAYGVEVEDEPFQRWLAGEPDDLAWFEPWLTTMRTVTGQGKSVRRVRVVTEPLSDYIRWEHSLTSLNIDAGEEVRFLPRGRAAGLDLPPRDFWLFDSRRVAALHFAEDGRFAGAEIITDPAEVVRHCHARDATWHHAVPYRDYAPD